MDIVSNSTLELELGPENPAPQWLLAGMPDADLYLLNEGGMHPIRGRRMLTLSPQLLNHLEMRGRTGAMLIAKDADGGYWRLRRTGAPDDLRIWSVQSVNDSRDRLRNRLRIALAPHVADHVLHDLRNPMNAMSLHVDLAAQILTMCAGTSEFTRITSSLRTIKDRLRDLKTLQNRTVALWLASSTDVLTTAGQVVRETLRLLRSLLMLPQAHLDTADLDLLDACAITADSSASLQLVLIAILLMSSAMHDESETPVAARRLRAHEEELSPDSGRVVLDIRARFQSASIETCLDAENVIGVFAALALLLDEHGIDIAVVPAGAHMTFPRRAAGT